MLKFRCRKVAVSSTFDAGNIECVSADDCTATPGDLQNCLCFDTDGIIAADRDQSASAV